MTDNVSINPTRVVTGWDTRWSYVNVWEPRAFNGGAPRYSVSLIIPKSDAATVRKIMEAVRAAYEEGRERLRGADGAVPPLSSIRNPLRDGDAERPDDLAYAGCWFLSASSASAPGIVDADCVPIIDRSEVYSGVYDRASIGFCAYSGSAGRGIACRLFNLQKLRDGEPLGAHPTPADDFCLPAPRLPG